MERRDFFKNVSLIGAGSLLLSQSSLADIPSDSSTSTTINSNSTNTREYWVKILDQIAQPVLEHLSKGELKAKMPIEQKQEETGHSKNKAECTHLEALGRLFCGIAPWLELGADQTKEGKLRAKYIDWSLKGISNAVNPNSPDYLYKNLPGQILVDTAFLAQGLLRSPQQIIAKLDAETKKNIVAAFKLVRKIKPYMSNWLLFAAMPEIYLMKQGEEVDSERIKFAVDKHLEWYKGDGAYGDGEKFHWDYYNSFVIHPMFLDVLKELKAQNNPLGASYELEFTRSQRYAAVLERLISPEGSFPVIGRSMAYRFGAFHSLAQMAMLKGLSKELKPAQVRCALTAIIKRTMNTKGNFDKDGWLTIGFCGHQPSIGENYISTGSLYLCAFVFLPLGLPLSDEFWSANDELFTAQKIWGGTDIPCDHAIEK